MTVGNTIKQIRKQRHMTQKQLGDLVGIDDATIRKYEAGKLNAKPDTLEKIAKALDVNVETLLFSELNYSRAMHQLFRILDAYGGDFSLGNRTIVDNDGNETIQNAITIYFGELTPFIEEWKENQEKLSKDDLEDYKHKFPTSSHVPASYIASLNK